MIVHRDREIGQWTKYNIVQESHTDKNHCYGTYTERTATTSTTNTASTASRTFMLMPPVTSSPMVKSMGIAVVNVSWTVSLAEG